MLSYKLVSETLHGGPACTNNERPLLSPLARWPHVILARALGLIAQFAERMGLEITEGIDVNVWSRSHQVREGGEVIEEWRHTRLGTADLNDSALGLVNKAK